MENNRQQAARILVVDDEAGMREGCRRALTSLGHSVETAPDLATGHRLICRQQFDLCLLDLMLPDGNGLDFLDLIHSREPTLICIIITGYGTLAMAVEAVRRGAYDFLTKPFTADELSLAVKQGLEQRRLKAIEARASELAQAKVELEQLDEIKSQLMLQMAHELRAPVAAAQSYLNLILGGYVSEAELKQTLERTRQLLQEMLELIADLLELARLKKAKEQLDQEHSPQEMAEILTGVADLLRSLAESKRQSLVVELLDRPTIWAKKEHMKQVWTNLISNAIKYTPEAGRILVRLSSDDVHLVGVVEDTGIGIAEQDLSNLFREFFRTEQAKATGQLGTGLGLSIVKQIVELYSGQIKVTSTPGKGSRFAFTLPLKPPAKGHDRETTSSEGTPQRLQMPAVRPPSEAGRPWMRPATHTRALMLGTDSPGEDDSP